MFQGCLLRRSAPLDRPLLRKVVALAMLLTQIAPPRISCGIVEPFGALAGQL